MQRGQLHSKQVLKASLIILPLTPRPGHVTHAADELGRVGWEGEGLDVWVRGRRFRLAPFGCPFRGRPVSGDDPPMTLYHLTPEGPGGCSLLSAGEQTAQRQDGRRIKGGERRKDGRKGTEHRRGWRRLSYRPLRSRLW